MSIVNKSLNNEAKVKSCLIKPIFINKANQNKATEPNNNNNVSKMSNSTKTLPNDNVIKKEANNKHKINENFKEESVKKKIKFESVSPLNIQPANKSEKASSVKISLNQLNGKNASASNSTTNKYLSCSRCFINYDLTEHLPKVISCNENACAKCADELSSFKCRKCSLNHKIGTTGGFSLNPTIIDMIKNEQSMFIDENNNIEMCEKEEEEKREVKEWTIKLGKEIEMRTKEIEKKWSSVRSECHDALLSCKEMSLKDFDKKIIVLNESKTRFLKECDLTSSKMLKYLSEDNELTVYLKDFEENMTILKDEKNTTLLSDNFELAKIDLDKLENAICKAKTRMVKLVEKLKETKNSLSDGSLKLNGENEENVEHSSSEESNKNLLSDDTIIISNKLINVFNKNLIYPLTRKIHFSLEPFEISKTLFKLVDNDGNVINEQECDFNFKSLKPLLTNIEETSFFAVFKVESKPKCYMYVKCNDKKEITINSLVATREIVFINNEEIFSYSPTKKAIFITDHNGDNLRHQINDGTILSLKNKNFQILKSSDDYFFVLQDNSIMRINKATKMCEDTHELHTGSDVTVLIDLNYIAVVIYKSAKEIQLIDLKDGITQSKISYGYSNSFNNIKLTRENELAFIYSNDIKFLKI